MQKNLTLIIIVVLALLGAWYFLNPQSAVPLTTLPQADSDAPFLASATLLPEQPVTGEATTLTFTFSHEDGTPVTDLMEHHGRTVHVLVAGEDLASLGHIHPDDFADLNATNEPGVYRVQYTFPEAGKYIVGVNVMNDDGELAQQFVVDVEGSPRMTSANVSTNNTVCVKGLEEEDTDSYKQPIVLSDILIDCEEGYEVMMTPSSKNIHAGEEVRLSYHIEKDGKAVTDLEPYLDSAIHLAVVPQSLDSLIHAHGDVAQAEDAEDDDHMTDDDHTSMDHDTHMDDTMEMEMSDEHLHDVSSSFGPDLLSESIVFPHAGTYRVFAQFKHNGLIITAPHIIKVVAGSAQVSTKEINLTIEDKKITSGETTVKVNKGDHVVLHITADTGEELHLHGYDVSTELSPDTTVELSFTANITGRFPFELEESKTELGAIEVAPQ